MISDFIQQSAFYNQQSFGDSSSMAERRTVDAVVEGSSPFYRPYRAYQIITGLSCSETFL
jgi:hypothetical protein